MRKRIELFLLLITFSLISFAQNKTIIGGVFDSDTKESVIQATVQLLKSDSTFITGSLSNEEGHFKIVAPKEGKYIIKITSVGYVSLYKNITIGANDTTSVGKLILKADAVMLKGTTITRNAAKVTLKEDTFIYNSSAYKTPEGSTIEELVKRLPGATVSDDGKITINGKEVNKILIDGKEFMTGDTKTALKNIPVSIIDKIKSYDDKSDLAKATGIEDGEEQTVLDFGVKQGMNKGVFGNVDLGIGTKSRYAERAMGAVFKDDLKAMAFASANNTNDMGFPGGGGRGAWGQNNNGLNALKMVGTNINYEKKDKLKIDGSLRWNHSNGDIASIASTENFVGNISSFTNSNSNTYKRGNEWNGNMRIEWKPDSMTTLLFRPEISISKSDNIDISRSAQFNVNPNLYGTDIFSTSVFNAMQADSALVNSGLENSVSYTNSQSYKLSIQATRKLNNNGRNIALRANVSHSNTNSNQISTNEVHLYQVLNSAGLDSAYQINRYLVSPEKNTSYSIKATYSEPIAKRVYLQFGYQFKYGLNTGNRSTYDFSNLGENFFSSITPTYRAWDSYLSLLPNNYLTYLDEDLSRSSRYQNYTHDIELAIKMNRKAYQLNAGVKFEPQRTHFVQSYLGVNTDTVRNVFNITPTLDFRYKFSDVSQLRFSYNGRTNQPSITQLLDIRDNSNPLNIRLGNPGLKPAFVSTFRLFYNNYNQKRQQSIMTFINFSTTRNGISNRVDYDATTGGRITRPVNINGNWDAMGVFMFNTALDSLGKFNVNSFSSINYNNYVGYLTQNAQTQAQKNITRALTLSERASLSYRISWVEVELNGSLNYTNSRNKLQASNNLNTWQFSYGSNLTFYLPWNMQLTTGLGQNSRRGFNDKAMNTNEFVWNAQVSQSFLKGSPLTISLQLYDILHNMSSVSRTITALQRSDVSYNTINSYAMLHVIYKVNLFGGKNAKGGPEGGPGRPGGMMPMGGFGRMPRR